VFSNIGRGVSTRYASGVQLKGKGMTTQARPDWNAEMDRQITATESAMALAKDNEQVIIAQRAEIDKLQAALRELIDESDSGAWHSSQDCKVEERDHECELCQALKHATAALVKEQTT
jgi:hypothetical protein